MIHKFFTWLENRVAVFPDDMPTQPKPALGGFVWFFTKPFLPLLLVAGFLGLLIAFIEVYVMAYVGRLVDILAAANRASFWQDHGLELSLMGLVVLVVLPLLYLVDRGFDHVGLRGNFAMRTRWLAHRYVLHQSLDFFQNDFAGRVATKVMQAALGVRDSVMKVTDVVIYVTVYFLASLIMVAQSDTRLMLPMLLWLSGYGAACYYFIPRLGKLSARQADMRSMVTGRLVDSYTNISTVKLFAHTDREEAYAKQGMTDMLGTVYASMRLSTIMTFTLMFLSGLLIFSMAATAIWLWYVNAITAGAIAFAIGLTIRLNAMSQWIMWETAGLFEDIGVVEDSVATLSKPHSVTDAPEATALNVSSGDIVFDHVTFNYGKPVTADKKPVLRDLSFHVKPGEKVGLVGRSGAGKSTVASLLLRFYDVQKGAIRIDGQNIASVTQDSLRANIGVVTQDTSLLHRSVLDNLRYGLPDASMAQVEAATAKAHADEFIRGLIDLNGRSGYEAHVGERGVKLSGGQRQRIAIARVLLKNAPILILDEATSALDSEVEAAIQESLYTLMEGKTVIAVAHRLSTIAAMDRLIIMDKGEIIETGSHQQLLQQGGLYAQLWKRQSGGFLVDEDDIATE